ncbi:WYL domain-containing protein [Desulfuromonas versatilis]|uniref:WYL domain-containing protein n=1 Tax=Desulfuromonas versatilis TaxID=2802975 RepID=A0ABM8HY81_9BACT|nr:WYL domain-containing protein [Desulfuromonas versatilis]BCR05678.1 WYL domain-containing protein [Desulfuromonas versatilis]
MGDHLVYERYLWFHSQVKAGKFPNAAGLAERFELSRKTAQRDIDRMADRLFAPLEYDGSRRGYHYTEHGFELPPIQVSQEELLAILLARNLLSASAGGLISRSIASFGKKLFASMGDLGLSEARMDEVFSATWNGYAPAQAETFRTVSEALLQQRLLSFTYQSPRTRKSSTRRVEPHHLQHYMGSWVLIAYCRRRSDWRKFFLSRMTEPKILPECFDPRPRADWQGQLEGGFGIFQGTGLTHVVLRFSPFRAAWIREQLWHPHQRLSEHPDGSLDLSFPVADFREIKLRVLQFGADVEVIEPEELRRQVREEIGRMVGVYRNG